jgi:ribosomal protein L40E
MDEGTATAVKKTIKTQPAPTAHDVLAARGHREQRLCSGIVCLECRARKPRRGGWSRPCPGDRRVFMGAA